MGYVNSPYENEIIAEKNGAYHERNQLVAALSRLFPSHLARHPESDQEWEDDWRWIVCVHFPILVDIGGAVAQAANLDDRWQRKETQATWHIHDSEYPLFRHLPELPNDWDGHTTEEKYKRLAGILMPMPRGRQSLWSRLRGQN